jgi:hypothetical protein
VTFYEPQPEPDVCYDPVGDELENPEGFEVGIPTAPMPTVAVEMDSRLVQLAKLAFPQTGEERRESDRRKKAKPAKRAAKKSAAGPRKPPSKRTMKKTAPKKATTKKTATKKAVAKSAAAKKGARKR